MNIVSLVQKEAFSLNSFKKTMRFVNLSCQIHHALRRIHTDIGDGISRSRQFGNIVQCYAARHGSAPKIQKQQRAWASKNGPLVMVQ